MLADLKQRVAQGLAATIRELFDADHDPIVEVPPRRELGDLAFPGALQLARVLKRAPRGIAEEILAAYQPPPEVDRVEVAGAGYLNLYLDRSAVAARLLADPVLPSPKAGRGKVVVEHTNINPNKAAHIGHLRNAVLGDVLVRVLRNLGYPVEVQNYIDDTGVQLADVVVGFLDLRGWSHQQVVEATAATGEDGSAPSFDYLCWDVYSEVGGWYEEDESRREHRRQTLHQLETGQGERAELGKLVARAIVARHLGTMARLGVGYDLLTRESDILGERFFEDAFSRLKESGAVHLEKDGKNAGCWVMPLSQSEEFAGLEDPDKVIVRSDGTVTYVGKDIAYQCWKFGLLGRDFHYHLWQAEDVWETGPKDGSTAEHPEFGAAAKVVNVIDARQSYLQRIVRAGLEALGHEDEAERSIHFAYEMVSLSADTARQLGYLDDGDDDDDETRSLEMSGRKGIGVKADDLLDQLVAKAGDEVRSRDPEMSDAEIDRLAADIATAALRYLMAKATTTRVIAFDLDDALAFEGETGPYIQYSTARVGNIRRRLEEEGLAADISADDAAALPADAWGDDLWDLVLATADSGEVVEKSGETLELSLLARHLLDLAQKFHALYNKHPILREEDATLRAVRLAAFRVFERGAGELAPLLGIPLPERM